MLEHQEAGQKYNSAYARLKSILKAENYDDGTYRVGNTEHTITVKSLHGGGMTIREWDSKSFKLG